MSDRPHRPSRLHGHLRSVPRSHTLKAGSFRPGAPTLPPSYHGLSAKPLRPASCAAAARTPAGDAQPVEPPPAAPKDKWWQSLLKIIGLTFSVVCALVMTTFGLARPAFAR